MKQIVIVGGGIAGLTVAYRLQQSAPDAAITLFEASDRAGGKILTEHIAGFTIEAGPDSFLTSKPAGMALCRELGLDGRLEGVNTATRRTFIMRDGELVDLPEGLSGLVPARLAPLFRSPLLSRRGKVRVALEPVVPASKGEEDESLGSFVRRRLGREAYERLVEALMTGIYGGDGDTLSLDATFPQLREMERTHGSLFRGFRRSARAHGGTTSGETSSPFVAPIGGMGEIVSALLTTMPGVEIRTGSAVTAVESRHGSFVAAAGGSEICADAVVLAAPAFAVAGLLDPLDETAAGILRQIPYASSATVSLGYRDTDLPAPLAGHGYIIPSREGRPAMACTWSSSKFDHRAPSGSALLRVFLGRSKRLDWQGLNDDDLAGLARDELHATVGIEADPVLTRVFRWPQAMPQYTVGHRRRMELLHDRLLRVPGLFLAGAAYSGVGVPGCIRSGEEAAQATLDFLKCGVEAGT